MAYSNHIRQSSNKENCTACSALPQAMNSMACKSSRSSNLQAMDTSQLAWQDCIALYTSSKNGDWLIPVGILIPLKSDAVQEENITELLKKVQLSSQHLDALKNDYAQQSQLAESHCQPSLVTRHLCPVVANIFFKPGEAEAWLGDFRENRRLIRDRLPLVIEFIDFAALLVDIWEKVVEDLWPF